MKCAPGIACVISCVMLAKSYITGKIDFISALHTAFCMNTEMRRPLIFLRCLAIMLLLIWSCSKKNGLEAGESDESLNRLPLVSANEGDTLIVSDADQDSLLTSHYGLIRIDQTVRGKDVSNFWEKGLNEIRYNIYEGDSLLAIIEINPEDFDSLYHADFASRARIWSSELLLVDTAQRKLVITNRFGLPESDNETHVLCVSDFVGDKFFMDSPFASSSGTNISFNKIVNCNGVYDFAEPLLEFTSCCTVFSDLINEKTLFYVVDWEDEARNNMDNAFLIDIVSKDTLESFLFNELFIRTWIHRAHCR